MMSCVVNRFSAHGSMWRYVVWLGLYLAATSWPAVLLGQESGGESYFGFTESDPFTGYSENAIGAKARLGVQTGPGIGRQQTLSGMDLMPYLFLEGPAGNGMIFGDLRVFRGEADKWGTNLGGGYRHYFESLDRIIGAYGFYDVDETSGRNFRQVMMGAETYGQLWDGHFNAYFPTGEKFKELSRTVSPNSLRFQGFNLLFDRVRTSGNALKGYDMEVAVPVLMPAFANHNVRVAAGWYQFNGDAVSNFSGWQGRISGNPIPSLELQVQVTNDKVFDTNVIFAASWTYGGFRQPDGETPSQFSRMTTHVNRLNNIVVGRVNSVESGVVAVNAATGQPFFIEHVESYAAPGGDGTAENPFQTLAQAQAHFFDAPANTRPGDIVYVHADSVYNGVGVVTEANVRTLGESNIAQHFITLAAGQAGPNAVTVLLPRATDPAIRQNRPQFNGAPGDGVTLVSNSEFSGFFINTANRRGVFGNNLSNVTFDYNIVANSGLGNVAGFTQGILLQNTQGTVNMRNTQVRNNINGTALEVSGGRGVINFTGDGNSTNNGGVGDIESLGDNLALHVHDMLAQGRVNLAGSVLISDLGQGILIENTLGSVTVDDATINNSSTTSINIRNSTGNFNFIGPVRISDVDPPLVPPITSGDGINIENLGAGSRVTFSDAVNGISMNMGGDSLARAFDIQNNAGSLITFMGPVNVEGLAADAEGINYVGNTGTLALPTVTTFASSVTINGGLNTININGNGTNTFFSIEGQTDLTTPAGSSINIQNDDGTTLFGGYRNRGREDSAVLITGSRGPVTFNGFTEIDGASANNMPAIDIINNAGNGPISFGRILVTETRGFVDGRVPNPDVPDTPLGSGIIGVRIDNNQGDVNIAELDVNDAFVIVPTLNRTTAGSPNGAALFINDSGNAAAGTGVTIGGGTVTSTTVSAVHIENSVANVVLNRINSDFATDFGPFLSNGVSVINSQGIFGSNTLTVTGETVNNVFSGGRVDRSGQNGYFLNNSGNVSLTGVTATRNGTLLNYTIATLPTGIRAISTAADNTAISRLTISDSLVNLNAGTGIRVSGVPNVDIIRTDVANNSGADPNAPLPGDAAEVFLEAGLAGNYVYRFQGGVSRINTTNTLATIQDADGDLGAVVMQSSVLALQASTLDLSFTNYIVNEGGDGAGVFLNWAGPVNASAASSALANPGFRNNLFVTQGVNDTGIAILPSNILFGNPQTRARVDVIGNNFQGVGGGTGVSVAGANVPIDLRLGQNQFTYAGIGTGLNVINGAPFSNFDIFSNAYTSVADGSTGFLFTLVNGPSNYYINNNIIQVIGAPGGPVSRGIIFTGILGQISLNPGVTSFNNSILLDQPGDITSFFNGSTSGSILVNGVPVP